ncbi:MAG: hypothetical protein H7144_01370 [Burkholderiales bacterium]|nr:hypothetical protein [Phycisphaerae bacterium]
MRLRRSDAQFQAARTPRRGPNGVEALESRVFLSVAPVGVALAGFEQPQNLLRDTRDLRNQRASVTQANAPYWRPRVGNFAIARAVEQTQSYLSARNYTAFALDDTLMRPALAAAPRELSEQDFANTNIIALPRPDGTMQRFEFAESSVMDPALAAQFPDIKTYSGTAVDDPNARVRFDVTPLGFHAQVTSPGATYYIDPIYHLDQSVYASYWRADMQKTEPFAFLDSDIAHAAHDDEGADHATVLSSAAALSPGAITNVTSGASLRTYRLAVAATGEYTAFFGGTVAGAQAAIVTAINRVSGIFENDLSIRLSLVANNASLVYTNAASDPYSNGDAFGMLAQNQATVDAVIGEGNYDIGHVFSTTPGGIAYIGVVGQSGYKARGETGRGAPVGDAFYVDYVAHEMGHQFGAEHTFNTSAPVSRNAATAYEPGSGSTIMGYAGLTGGNSDLQSRPDAYFHWISQQQIIDYVDGTIPWAGTRTGTGNSLPSVYAGSDYVIPAHTPFALTGAATDANGDALTYAWEQADLGPANLLDAPDNGSSPLFRSFVPGSSPTRSFPKLSTVLSGATADNLGERLPTTNRQLKFRLTVRDNRAGGGGVTTDDSVLYVVNTGASFSVTTADFPGTNWATGSAQSINWNVAGTNANGINTANVRISLSTDGGLTFPHILAASTPNDGSEPITVPTGLAASAAGRIKIEAIGNVFYDISNANLNITPTASLPDLNVAAGQTVELLASQAFNYIGIQAGGTLSIRAGTQTVLRVKTLVIADNGINYTGKLELHDNDLVLDYTGGSSPYATILNMVKKGLALLGGNGQGIASSDVDTLVRPSAILAVVDNVTSGGQISSLSGVPVPLQSIVVKYTWRGDTNLDGRVSGSDFALADTGFSAGGLGWFYGDVNYDGVTNGSDYALMDTGFSSQTGVL